MATTEITLTGTFGGLPKFSSPVEYDPGWGSTVYLGTMVFDPETCEGRGEFTGARRLGWRDRWYRLKARVRARVSR